MPGRQLRATGIPTSTLVTGGVLGVVGFFVIPVVGLLVGWIMKRAGYGVGGAKYQPKGH